MRVTFRLAVVACIVMSAMPYAVASAEAAGCGYALQLTQGIVDGTGPRVPLGYEVAEQPSASPWPAQLTVFGGAITTTDKASCPTGAVAVRFQSRDANHASFQTRRTFTTDAQGTFDLDARPTRTGTVRAVATAPDGSALGSALIVVRVRTYVSATYLRSTGCVLTAVGSTFPVKPHHPVRVEAVVGGRYRDVAASATDVRGVYRVRWNAGCGKHDLDVSVPASAANDAGRSLFVRFGVVAR
jgi:hypothetical protein